MTMVKNPDWLLQKPFAHRGLHMGKGCPENSLCAFSKAKEGAIPIELDVHVIADNEVVVFHDDDLKRMTGTPGAIEEKALPELQKLRLYDSQEPIPTLKQVLELVKGEVPILVEIKNEKYKKGIEPFVLNTLRGYRGNFAIQSFNPATLGWFKRNAPEIPRGQLSCDFRDERMNPLYKIVLRMMLLNGISRPDYIGYDLRALPAWAARMLRKRVPVILWTVRNDAEKRIAEELGDNYIYELDSGKV